MKKFVLSVSLVLTSSVSAYAADGDIIPLDDGPQLRGAVDEHFGYVYAGGSVSIPSSGTNISTSNTFGAKYAYEPMDASIGAQIDGDLNYSFSNSNLQWAQLTGHVTKAVSHNTKLGAFAGYDNNQRLAGGFEVMYSFSPRTWAQSQFAAFDLTKAGQIGFGAGGSIHHSLSPNVSLRADGFFTNVSALGLTEFGADAAVLYNLDIMPVTLGLSGSYDNVSVSGVSAASYGVNLKAQYSFGGPADGVHGHLFRTNVLGLTP